MSERRTRKELIDKQLFRAGWIRNYIKEEVNTVRSNFAEKDYVPSEGRGDNSGRFVDYLLLAEDNSPIAFIEAKSIPSRKTTEGRKREPISTILGANQTYSRATVQERTLHIF